MAARDEAGSDLAEELTDHVRQAEGVASHAAGQQSGDDALQAIGDIPGGKPVSHACENCHPLSLVPCPHLPTTTVISNLRPHRAHAATMHMGAHSDCWTLAHEAARLKNRRGTSSQAANQGHWTSGCASAVSAALYLTDTALELPSHLVDPKVGVLNGAGDRLVGSELLRKEAGLSCTHMHSSHHPVPCLRRTRIERVDLARSVSPPEGLGKSCCSQDALTHQHQT